MVPSAVQRRKLKPGGLVPRDACLSVKEQLYAARRLEEERAEGEAPEGPGFEGPLSHRQ